MDEASIEGIADGNRAITFSLRQEEGIEEEIPIEESDRTKGGQDKSEDIQRHGRISLKIANAHSSG